MGGPAGWLAALSWLTPRLGDLCFRCLDGGSDRREHLVRPEPRRVAVVEDRHGPVRAVITFVLVTAIALLGLKRTAAAGVLLLAAGIIPVAVSSLGSFLGIASLSMVSVWVASSKSVRSAASRSFFISIRKRVLGK